MTPSSSLLPVLAEANLLGVMCGAGVNGAGTQLRELLRANPDVGTDDAVAAMHAGFDVTAPDRLVRRHLKAAGS